MFEEYIFESRITTVVIVKDFVGNDGGHEDGVASFFVADDN